MATDRKSSSLPIVLIVCACASIGAYFAFFRAKSGPLEAAPPPAAESAPKVELAAFVAPPVEPAPPPVERKEEPKAPPPPPKPEPVAARPSPLHEIEELCAQNRWREARAKLAPLFAGDVSDADRAALARKGIEISQQLLQQKPDEKDVELYEIQQGDTLEGIAKKFKALNGVKGSILLVNNYKENAILRAGRKVRVPKGTWSVVVDKSLFKLWICYEGAPFKVYTITTGAPSKETPAAKFVVGGKNPKPAWWPPSDVKLENTKVPVPYGDKLNPLGDWWISLDHDLHHGIGIHGTNDPGSMGTKASNGCVRMLNEEVGDVAALAFKGMTVSILE